MILDRAREMTVQIMRAETRTMPAGREIDALIAEKVMGWQDVAYHEEIDDEIDGEYCYSPADWYGQAPDPLYSGIIPNYSTNIEMAWRVVDWMIEYAHDFELEWNGIGLGDKTWFCYMGKPAHANTPALAICRAALATM